MTPSSGNSHIMQDWQQLRKGMEEEEEEAVVKSSRDSWNFVIIQGGLL